MIHGRCMAVPWRCSRVGILIRDSFCPVRESVLNLGSQWRPSAGSPGVGTIGDTIGTTREESSTTTTHTSRTARPSSIEITFTDTSMVIPRFMHRAVGVPLEECTRAPSADLLTEELREGIASAVSEALEASMAEAGDKGE